MTRVQIKVVSQGAITKEGVPRDPSFLRMAPLTPGDEDILLTPLCPESCFYMMEADQNSRCEPTKPVPAGMEGEVLRKKHPPSQSGPVE